MAGLNFKKKNTKHTNLPFGKKGAKGAFKKGPKKGAKKTA